MTHEHWMKLALREAERAFESGEVPVGAVVVKDGHMIGRGYNQIEMLRDPTAHAEMIALTSAVATVGSKWLQGATLYVTLEPCAMCAGAIVLSRLQTLVIGADDPKTGACGSLYDIVRDERLNHRVEVIRGILEQPSSELLKEFFRRLRNATPSST
jgi:tRNA(adenine34) deaminase